MEGAFSQSIGGETTSLVGKLKQILRIKKEEKKPEPAKSS